MIFREFLQIERARLKVKSKDVAESCGISKQYYSNIENGKDPVPVDSWRFWFGLKEVFGWPWEEMIAKQKRALKEAGHD